MRWDDSDEKLFYFAFSPPAEQSRSIGTATSDQAATARLIWFTMTPPIANNTWNLGLYDGRRRYEGELSLRGGYQHYSPYGRLNLSGSVQPNQYRSISAGWNGSITATRHGVALHDYSPANNARMMIDRWC